MIEKLSVFCVISQKCQFVGTWNSCDDWEDFHLFDEKIPDFVNHLLSLFEHQWSKSTFNCRNIFAIWRGCSNIRFSTQFCCKKKKSSQQFIYLFIFFFFEIFSVLGFFFDFLNNTKNDFFYTYFGFYRDFFFNIVILSFYQVCNKTKDKIIKGLLQSNIPQTLLSGGCLC